MTHDTEPTNHTETKDLSSPEYYINRELSNFYFNQRVLEQAVDESHPLLERLKFLLIFSSNLDEFFEIRVAGLKQSILFGREMVGIDGMTTVEILRQVSDLCHETVKKQYTVLNDILMPAMADEGIHFLRRSQWTPAQEDWVENYVKTEVLPIISPIGLDPAHPFPRLVNKSLNFIVDLEGKDAFGRDLGLAILPAPRTLPRLFQVPKALAQKPNELIFLSSMIHAHANLLFPGMKVKGCYQFRITRNADLDVDMDGIADLALALRGELHSRRFGTAVRLEVADNCPTELTDFLLRELNLTDDDLYRVNGPVNLKRLMRVPDMLGRSDLLYPPFTPAQPKGLKLKDNIFDAVAKRDYLLLHPFESFLPVVQMLRQASTDPNVVAIKQTLYRSGDKSPIVDALMTAARNGKEVIAVVELRARFDEEENLELASRLQEAGAVVVYGVVGYKTHAKMILIVRRENGVLKRYCHLGTGNYHLGNAKLYTDYSLLTAEAKICEDVHRLFQQLTGMGKTEKMNKLYQAPFTLKKHIIKLIENEIKAVQKDKNGHLILKCNGLTDSKVIQALYRASQAGVRIDLVIRGMSCLKAGIPGVSDNIRVFSIIGRFLEHTRCYYFANAKPTVYCASADLMERNLNHRVETLFPVEQPDLAERLHNELELYISDQVQRWQQQPDGTYLQHLPEEGLSPQTQLLGRLTASPQLTST